MKEIRNSEHQVLNTTLSKSFHVVATSFPKPQNRPANSSAVDFIWIAIVKSLWICVTDGKLNDELHI